MKTLYGFAGTVKALGGGRVSGIGIPFGEPDCVGDIFTEKTKLGLEDRLAVPILYSHGHDALVRDEELGKIRVWKMRSEGWHIEGELDLTMPHAGDIYELALAGELGWSSACVGHLTHRKAQTNGTNLLLKWIVAEWSLTTMACSTETPASAGKAFAHVSLKEAMRRHALTPAQQLREKHERLLRKIEGRGPSAAELRETSLAIRSQIARHQGWDWMEDQRAQARRHRLQRDKEKESCSCHSKPKTQPQIITVDRNQQRKDYHSELRTRYPGGYIYADLEIRKALQRFDQSHAT